MDGDPPNNQGKSPDWPGMSSGALLNQNRRGEAGAVTWTEVVMVLSLTSSQSVTAVFSVDLLFASAMHYPRLEIQTHV